ncbi:MAG: hypothetical protein HPY54_07260 [Chthonomonadetes bacterium]|nr:hypothetical protein [Chthonomonadetes bacterium]
MNPVPDLVDNTTSTLASVLNALLESADSPALSVCTAYFNLEALENLQKVIERLQSVRLLLGTEQEVGFVVGQRLRRDLESAFAQGKEGTLETLRRWKDYLSQPRVEVRCYKKGFLHGKAYLVDGVPTLGAIGIVGSSNFTGAGLTTNMELNAVLKQQSAVEHLRRWYEQLWDQSEEYKHDLVQLLDVFARQYAPYEIYIKVVYEAFRDKLQSSLQEKEGDPSPIALADFQHEGYLAAREVLDNYGGVLIADSVGLGKTFLALRLLDDYAYRRRETALIVCPAALRDTVWKPLLQAHAIPHHIESMERISQQDCPIDELARYKIVVVDESHNFRNPNANRWENLFRVMSQASDEKKLILLTATPVNNTVFDLYHQLRLITRDRKDYFADAGISDLESYFRRAEATREALYEVLEAVAVRRSRSFIRKNYPHARIDGQALRFPDRVIQSVRYDLEKSYGSTLYRQVAQAIENLRLAPYQVDAYRTELRRRIPVSLFDGEQSLMNLLLGSGWKQEEAQRFAMDLGRQTSLAHIMRVLYLKRLESSVEALRISLQRQLDFQRKFLEALEQGKRLTSALYHRYFVQMESADDQAEAPDNQLDLWSRLEDIDTSLYRVENIKADVKHDIESLEALLEKLSLLTPEQDEKLQVLKRLLTTQLAGQKVLLFSYFKDTARYLYRHLHGDGEVLRAFNRIAITDSNISPEERRSIVQRFAPKANCPVRSEPQHEPGKCGYCCPKEEVQLLLSTDVLSEGQNLQDASIIINYDLHWNPVRMVQRIGRIDRIGSPHERIDVYNFHPEDKLEDLLNLMKRLHEKLDAINRTVGLDASVLGEVPNPMDFNTLRRIAEEDQQVLDDLERESELNVGEFLQADLLDFLKRVGEQVMEGIPLGMGTARYCARGGTPGFFVALRNTQTDKHYWLFAPASDRNVVESRLQAISHIRCNDGEPAAPLPEDFDPAPFIHRLRRHLVQRLNQVAHRLPILPAPQNHIVARLQTMPSSAARNQLLEYLREPLPATHLRDLRPIWQQNRAKSNKELLQVLTRFMESHPRPSVPAPDVREVGEKDIECVAWMLVLERQEEV